VTVGTLIPEGTTHLFQYGSNMDLPQFKRRIEDEYDRYAPPGTPVHVTVLGPAALGGWHLHANLWSATRECRVLNITEEDGAVVRGVLYEISAALVTRCDGRRSVVDRLEGHRTTVHPENYAKVCITVDLDGELLAQATENQLIVTFEGAMIAVLHRLLGDGSVIDPGDSLGGLASVVDAVRLQDPEAARQAMRTHLERVANFYGLQTGQHAALETLPQ
jgi:2-polyprenyl-6-methoxyphenol hydroxylase-like FAD-dependent oxidoreductase